MINYDFNKKGVNTTVCYENTSEPILVGDRVKFVFNEFFGEVEGLVCFKDGKFGTIIDKSVDRKLNGFFSGIFLMCEKVEENELNGKTFLLTKDMIHQCATPNGGFTTAQVEYLGFTLKETWIEKAMELRVNKEQLKKFKSLGTVKAKELKRLKQRKQFFNIYNALVN